MAGPWDVCSFDILIPQPTVSHQKDVQASLHPSIVETSCFQFSCIQAKVAVDIGLVMLYFCLPWFALGGREVRRRNFEEDGPEAANFFNKHAGVFTQAKLV